MLPYAILSQQNMSFTIANIATVLEQKEILIRAQTYAFTVLGMSQLFHAIGMRNVNKSLFKMNHLDNKLMIAACILGFFLQFAVTEVPFLITAFGTVDLSRSEWLLLGGLAAFPLLAHEILNLFSRQSSSEEEGKLNITTA